MIMGITLKKIAEDLNISKTTVSFVLSGVGAKKGISEATQQRIIEYAKSHQYEPNLLAKSLYRGVSDTIGLIVPSISDMFYSQLAQEIELEAKKHGYMIIICTSERDAKQEVKMIRMLKAKQVDGLIMAPTEHCKTELNHLLDEKFPFVLIDRYFPDFDSNYVVLDDFAATRTLINNMIRQGRRNIALVTTDSNVSAIYLRTEAYLKVTSQEKLEYNPALCCVVRRNDYADDIVNVLDSLFAAVPDVDGFYFTAHYPALETIKYMIKRKLDMKRFSMSCIHYNPVFDALAPGMEIARIPVEKIGACSMGILLKNIKSKEPVPLVHEFLEPDFFKIEE